MKLYIYPALIGAVILIVGGVALYKTTSSEPMPSQEAENAAPVETPEASTTLEAPIDKEKEVVAAPTPSGITMAEVALHADATSCWSVVNGEVYDLTSWIGKHPGGEDAILRICGTDGTAAFMSKHGGKEKPEATLATFRIGTLAP